MSAESVLETVRIAESSSRRTAQLFRRHLAVSVQVIRCENDVAWQPAGGQQLGHESELCSGFDLFFGSTEPHRAERRS